MPVFSPANSQMLSPVSASFHTAAVWPMAPGADGGDRYSTGGVPGKHRQPGDMNNFWHLSVCLCKIQKQTIP